MDKKPKATNAKPTKVVAQARIDINLAAQVQKLSAAAGDDSASDFVRRAIENEVSRVTLCSPAKELTPANLGAKLTQIQDILSAQDAQVRLTAELLKSLCQVVGVPTS